MMLFLIRGSELEPRALWDMRPQVAAGWADCQIVLSTLGADGHCPWA